ncbi:MAG TPA: biotin/lipoate A/B protein ligase family protein [Pirellulaceae bacterium]|nr:biotin/lipoate A/B protein ligase family protein [Pirellulaceae bacterium]
MLRVAISSLSPVEELACEEALLQALDAGERDEFLRIWEFDEPVVVLGRASRRESEANVPHCVAHGVPILRRCSGGTAILGGPGCLMYTVGVSLRDRTALRSVEAAHSFVLDPLAAALAKRLEGVTRQGTCDIAWNDRKFSGNSLRMLKEAILYHGTLLYDLSPERIETYLNPDPPRQPEYRRGRRHEDFVALLPLSREQLLAAIEEAFPTQGDYGPLPRDWFEKAMAERYSRPEWHERI